MKAVPCLALALLLAQPGAYAGETAELSAFAAPNTAPPVAAPFSLSVGLGGYSSPADSQPLGTMLTADVSAPLSAQLNLIGSLVLTLPSEGPPALSVYRSDLGVSWNGLDLSRVFRLTAKATTQLPLDYSLRVGDGFELGLTAAPRLTADLGPLGLRGLSAYYEAAVTDAFHSAAVTGAGTVNYQTLLSNTLGVQWSATGKLTLGASLGRIDRWDALGGQDTILTANSFALYQWTGWLGTLVGAGNFPQPLASGSDPLPQWNSVDTTFYGAVTFSY